jgi:hypothetical protein
MCHQFRRERAPAFFVTPQRGPRDQPKKSAAHDTIIALRKRNYSVYEISEALKERHVRLSPTAVREVLKGEGFAPLPRRRDDERPVRPRPTVEPVADVRAFSLAPRRIQTRCGGLFLFLPGLVRLHLTELAQAARLPGSRMIPGRPAVAACLWTRTFRHPGLNRDKSKTWLLPDLGRFGQLPVRGHGQFVATTAGAERTQLRTARVLGSCATVP